MKIKITPEQIASELPEMIRKIEERTKEVSSFWTQTIKIVLTLATTSLYGSVPLFQFMYDGKENIEGASFWCWGWLCLLVSIILLVWGLIEQARHSVMVLNKDQGLIKNLTEAFHNKKEFVEIEITSIVLYMHLYFSVFGLFLFVLGMGFLMIGVIGGSFPPHFILIKKYVLFGEVGFFIWMIWSYWKFYESQKNESFINLKKE